MRSRYVLWSFFLHMHVCVHACMYACMHVCMISINWAIKDTRIVKDIKVIEVIRAISSIRLGY
jgi:hypothetical protein